MRKAWRIMRPSAGSSRRMSISWGLGDRRRGCDSAGKNHASLRRPLRCRRDEVEERLRPQLSIPRRSRRRESLSPDFIRPKRQIGFFAPHGANKCPVRTENRTHAGRVGLPHMCHDQAFRFPRWATAIWAHVCPANGRISRIHTPGFVQANLAQPHDQPTSACLNSWKDVFSVRFRRSKAPDRLLAPSRPES